MPSKNSIYKTDIQVVKIAKLYLAFFVFKSPYGFQLAGILQKGLLYKDLYKDYCTRICPVLQSA